MRPEVMLLFRELADLTSAGREHYFERHQVRPDLRAELESLFHYDFTGPSLTADVGAEARDFLESRDVALEGRNYGPYRAVSLLGRGGAGAVFLAQRTDGQIEQRVAIKVLRQDSQLPLFRSRFLQERQILASLQHPGIARLLDAGQTGDGKPYLVMDYVDGTPIDVYAAKRDLRGKLNLFLQVCEAVSYAHRNLVIHRDLKPSNILVNAAGEPKLLDFGIAKILDAATDQTRTQERLLTPDYASPEQVRGAPQTTATDVYSLGAVLYDLLTGRSPHDFSGQTPEAIEAAICTTEPAIASTLNPEVPRDVDFIVSKALRKEPEERYASVEAMAGDIRAFLEWRPVRARSGNAWYRTRKFARRYRVLVAAATLTVAGLSAGLYVANRERLVAQQRFRQLHLLSSKVFDLDRDIGLLPGATQARHNLVSASLGYLEGLGAFAHGDLDLAQEIGEAYLRVARIQGVPTKLNLGESAKAEESLKKADGFIDPVLASRPLDAAALLISAGIAHDRMVIASEERRDADVKAHAAKAVARLDRLSRADNLTDAQRNEMAGYYPNIALAYMNLRLYDDAVRYARRSVEFSANLPSAGKIRAASLSLIGNSLRSQGHLEEALQAIREARSVAEGPIYANPTDRAINLYGILMREARILGQNGGINLGRPDEAIPVYEKAVELTEEAASTDPRDQLHRDHLATCARELADILEEKEPQRSLALFDLAIRRLREVKNNLRARRNEAELVAESSYPLRRLHRLPEARIQAAFDLLRETRDYPAEKINPNSEAVVALRAQADYESAVGDRRLAVQIYERLFAGMMATKPDPLGDLGDATNPHLSSACCCGAG